MARSIALSKSPIVMIVNDLWSRKLVTLRQNAEIFKYERIYSTSITKRLAEIAEAEGIKYDLDTLQSIASRSGGDVRAAIQDAEMLSALDRTLTKNSVGLTLGDRSENRNVFEALRSCWHSSTLKGGISSLSETETDYFELLDWAFGNSLALFSTPKELREGLELMSMADMLRARIRRHQEWKLVPYYIAILAASICIPPREKNRYLNLRRPSGVAEKWSRISKINARRKLVSSISRTLHERSSIVSNQILPLIDLATGKDGIDLAR
jgi:hypothetical protein